MERLKEEESSRKRTSKKVQENNIEDSDSGEEFSVPLVKRIKMRKMRESVVQTTIYEQNENEDPKWKGFFQ